MTEKERSGILRDLKEGKKTPCRAEICSSDSEAGLKGGCNKNGGQSESNLIVYNYACLLINFVFLL